MKKLIYQTALFAYVNTICFRNAKPTCTKISEQFNRNIIYDSENNPYVSHDKLQRLLCSEEGWQKYLHNRYGNLIKSVKTSKRKSFLIIDDTVIAKPYSKELDLLSWVYSSGDKQYLYGINVVFLIYTDGKTRYPVCFRIWNKDDKKTKIDLAIELLAEAKRIKPDYVLMDSFYPAAKLLRALRKLKFNWISKLKSNRLLDGIQVKDFFNYRYGNSIGRLSENIKTLVVKDNNNYWATNDFTLTANTVKKLYRTRQTIEEFFKILKSELSLEGCHSRQNIAQINHIYFVLFAFCQLEYFRILKNIATIYKLRLVFFDCIIPKTFNWKIDIMLFA